MPMAGSWSSYLHPLLPQKELMSSAFPQPMGQFLPASQQSSWTAPAVPGSNFGQVPRWANSQLGMPDLACGGICLGPWAVLKKTVYESLETQKELANKQPVGFYNYIEFLNGENSTNINIESVACEVENGQKPSYAPAILYSASFLEYLNSFL